MHTRLATEHDVPAITAITNQSIATSFAHFATCPIAVEDDLADFRQNHAMLPWVVAVEEDENGKAQCIGYARSSKWKSRCAYDWAVELGVYVHPDHHRKGIAKALYTQTLTILKAQNYRTAIGGIALPNEPSVRLHESMGFKKAGVFEHVGYKMNAWRSVGYWQLHLVDDLDPPKQVLSVADACAQLDMRSV
ncbi:MAG: N-acetyltransferase [Phycisphaeraceae bacterium]|nr:N-acetyltransferase [Phycisphaerales bacterium]MCB9859148.1 N-acetyltransferase [Phycisphaeraceae bacterium]